MLENTNQNVDKGVYVLYGSQTGNASEIAKLLKEDIQDTITSHVTCNSLDDYIKENTMETLKNMRCLLIICSTTGNGDPPDNASKFWRSIKSRKCDKKLFDGLYYSVLGLGDTNYDKFCYMGKQIHKRMEELSAKSMLPLCCVDEVGDMEEMVEEWMEKIKEKVKEQME